jgi:ABC-type transporter Mla MlaB component
MKTSKRKRSPKSAPVEALDMASVPAAADSAEPVAAEVVAAEPANEPVVAEVVAPAEVLAPESVAEVAAPESVTAEALVSESAVVEAVVADSEPVVAIEASEPVVDAPSAPIESKIEATTVDPVIVLAANCSVKDAAALKTSLCAVANESAAVTLDTSAVERVDTATMQLLCAFVRDRSARNQSVAWRGVSQALNDAVRLLGVAAMLGFDQTKGVAA